MVGEKLGVDMHVVSADQNAVRNLMLAVERCHLDVEAVVATPYAAGLAALVDDEAEMGAAVIDLGGGTTSIGVFAGGHLVHTDASPSAATMSHGHRPRALDHRVPTPSG